MKTFLSLTAMTLASNKMRTFLASLGVMIGIASVIIMVSIGKGSEQEVLDVIAQMGENLITINAGEMKRRGGRLRLTGQVTTLTVRDARQMAREVPELAEVAPFNFQRMQVKAGNLAAETTVAGSTPNFLKVRGYSVETGAFFEEKDMKQAGRVVVIGPTVVKNVFGDEPAVGRVLRVGPVPFKVVGVFRAKGLDTDGMDQDDIVVIPLTALQRRVLNKNFISTIYARADSRKNIDRAVRGIRDVLRKRHKLRGEEEDDFTIVSQLDLEALKQETSELFTRLIAGVAAISLVVGGIGILAVMLVSVKERTREIGLRRALGATRGAIIRQFVLESVAIGVMGGVIGIVLGVSLTLGLDRFGPWTLVLHMPSVYLATGVCVLIALLFGVGPAIKASRLDPMVALTVE
jgi:putative ABC transport system permease protein